MDEESNEPLNCQACDTEINIDVDGFTDLCARLERGYFAITDDAMDNIGSQNIKASLYICANCWLTDLDLCAFFNKIGWQIR